MKNIITTAVITMLFAFNNAFSQNINWKSFSEKQNQIAGMSFGLDNSVDLGLHYGYKLNAKFPILLNAEFSSPFGKNIVDDFKTKLGGQIEVGRINNFSATIKANGIFRRYQTSLIRLLNFGSEFSAVAGYYKPKWYVAGEFGFDKAIVTHFKNSSLMKDFYPAVQDGWYIPTGGYFFYGIQAGYSFTKNDINLKLGKTIQQDLETKATLPIYLQLGYSRRF